MLSQSFVEDAVKLLVTRFIPLDPADLEGWMTDPEEWVNMEERDNDLWEFELRVSFRSYNRSRILIIVLLSDNALVFSSRARNVCS